ncbi:MAG: PDZ domain-containing protein [Xanthomonadales bacterium]|nr:PDZ domain-containing protein [Xanthomonadales bacterium]
MHKAKVIMILAALAACASTPGFTADEAEIEAARKAVERARDELRRATEALRDAMGDRHAPVVHRQFFTHTARPMIGVVMADDPDRRGVRLSGVTPGGPAEKAGLNPGDVIVAIDGVDLAGSDAVDRARALLDDMQEGDRYTLDVRTGEGQERTLTVEAEMHTPNIRIDVEGLGGVLAPEAPLSLRLEDLRADLDRLRARAPEMRAFRFGDDQSWQVWNFGWQWSGLELAQLNSQLGRYFGTERGALVLDATGVQDPDLIAGDVIVGVEGEAVASPKEVMRLLRDREPGDIVVLEVVRDGRTIDVEVTAPEGSPHKLFFDYRFGFDTEDETDS